MAKYKNITDRDLTVIGVGLVKAGETVEIDGTIKSANLELVKEMPVKKEVAKPEGEEKKESKSKK